MTAARFARRGHLAAWCLRPGVPQHRVASGCAADPETKETPMQTIPELHDFCQVLNRRIVAVEDKLDRLTVLTKQHDEEIATLRQPLKDPALLGQR